MESALGDAWGDLSFADAAAFLAQPDARALQFVTIAMVLTGALALCISDASGRYSHTWIAVNFLIETTVAILGARYFLSLQKKEHERILCKSHPTGCDADEPALGTASKNGLRNWQAIRTDSDVRCQEHLPGHGCCRLLEEVSAVCRLGIDLFNYLCRNNLFWTGHDHPRGAGADLRIFLAVLLLLDHTQHCSASGGKETESR